MKIKGDSKLLIQEIARESKLPEDELIDLAVLMLVTVTETMKVQGKIILELPEQKSVQLNFTSLEKALLTNSDDFLTEK
jgi:hypothetical protein